MMSAKRTTRTLTALAVAGGLALTGCAGSSGTRTTQAGSPIAKPDTKSASPVPEATPTQPAAPADSGATAPVTAASGSSAPATASSAAPQPNATAPAKTASGTAMPTPKPGAAASPGKAAPAPAPGAAAGAAPTAGAANNGGATDVGVTASEIKLGGIYMYGMALGNLLITPMYREMRAVSQLVNDQGGIYGRRITYLDCDDGQPDPARTKACYKKLVESDKIFAFMGGATWDQGELMPSLAKDQIPWAAPVSLFREEWQSPWAFPIHMGMQREAHAGGQWVADILKPKTVGLLCLTNAEMQATCDASTDVLAKNGIKVIKRINTPAETPDASGDVLAFRAANPDHIIHYTTHPAVTARFMLDASQQGYWPPKGISGNHMAAEIIGSLIGDYPAQHGYWTNTTYKLWGPEYIAWAQKYVPDNAGRHHHITQGEWFGANVFFDALKKIGPNLTRAAVKHELETGEYVTPPGFGPQKFMWSPEGRSARGTAARHEYMYKYVKPDTTASKDGAATPAGLVPAPERFEIEDTFD